MTRKKECCTGDCNQGRTCHLRGTRKEPGLGRGGSKAAIAARRAIRCARILLLLEDGPLTSGEISKELGINPIAGYRCLAYMRDDLRQIHSIPANNRRKMNQWALGPDASLKSKDAALDQSFAERRFTVPARQIGMVRDALVAALFGAPHSN